MTIELERQLIDAQSGTFTWRISPVGGAHNAARILYTESRGGLMIEAITVHPSLAGKDMTRLMIEHLSSLHRGAPYIISPEVSRSRSQFLTQAMEHHYGHNAH